MNITVKIESPGLVAAIQALAGALNHTSVQVMPKNEASEPQHTEKFQFVTPDPNRSVPDQQAPPVQHQPPSAVPTAQPGQQYQQAPNQVPFNSAPMQHAPAPPEQQLSAQQPQQAVPTSAQVYSMDKLAVAATQLMDAGRQSDLLNLLATFGVQTLMQLPQEQYGAFATKLREMGAKI